MKKHRKQNRHKHPIDMETKITKGEWILKEQGDASEYCILTPENRWVVAFRLNGERMEEEIANAKLIVAAPDLLNALDAVMRSYERYCPERYYKDDNVALANDAIKKATE